MTTKVGSQTKFVNALQELVELDYDAVEAYEAAIERLKNSEYKSMLQKFKKDHQRHILDISKVLVAHGENVPKGSDIKKWLLKGKVVIASLLSDNLILTAMQTNEVDTNAAYEKMNSRQDVWDDVKDILKKGWEDEKRHKAWLDSRVK